MANALPRERLRTEIAMCLFANNFELLDSIVAAASGNTVANAGSGGSGVSQQRGGLTTSSPITTTNTSFGTTFPSHSGQSSTVKPSQLAEHVISLLLNFGAGVCETFVRKALRRRFSAHMARVSHMTPTECRNILRDNSTETLLLSYFLHRLCATYLRAVFRKPALGISKSGDAASSPKTKKGKTPINALMHESGEIGTNPSLEAHTAPIPASPMEPQSPKLAPQQVLTMQLLERICLLVPPPAVVSRTCTFVYQEVEKVALFFLRNAQTARCNAALASAVEETTTGGNAAIPSRAEKASATESHPCLPECKSPPTQNSTGGRVIQPTQHKSTLASYDPKSRTTSAGACVLGSSMELTLTEHIEGALSTIAANIGSKTHAAYNSKRQFPILHQEGHHEENETSIKSAVEDMLTQHRPMSLQNLKSRGKTQVFRRAVLDTRTIHSAKYVRDAQKNADCKNASNCSLGRPRCCRSNSWPLGFLDAQRFQLESSKAERVSKIRRSCHPNYSDATPSLAKSDRNLGTTNIKISFKNKHHCEVANSCTEDSFLDSSKSKTRFFNNAKGSSEVVKAPEKKQEKISEPQELAQQEQDKKTKLLLQTTKGLDESNNIAKRIFPLLSLSKLLDLPDCQNEAVAIANHVVLLLMFLRIYGPAITLPVQHKVLGASEATDDICRKLLETNKQLITFCSNVFDSSRKADHAKDKHLFFSLEPQKEKIVEFVELHLKNMALMNANDPNDCSQPSTTLSLSSEHFLSPNSTIRLQKPSAGGFYGPRIKSADESNCISAAESGTLKKAPSKMSKEVKKTLSNSDFNADEARFHQKKSSVPKDQPDDKFIKYLAEIIPSLEESMVEDLRDHCGKGSETLATSKKLMWGGDIALPNDPRNVMTRFSALKGLLVDFRISSTPQVSNSRCDLDNFSAPQAQKHFVKTNNKGANFDEGSSFLTRQPSSEEVRTRCMSSPEMARKRFGGGGGGGLAQKPSFLKKISSLFRPSSSGIGKGSSKESLKAQREDDGVDSVAPLIRNVQSAGDLIANSSQQMPTKTAIANTSTQSDTKRDEPGFSSSTNLKRSRSITDTTARRGSFINITKVRNRISSVFDYSPDTPHGNREIIKKDQDTLPPEQDYKAPSNEHVNVNSPRRESNSISCPSIHSPSVTPPAVIFEKSSATEKKHAMNQSSRLRDSWTFPKKGKPKSPEDKTISPLKSDTPKSSDVCQTPQQLSTAGAENSHLLSIEFGSWQSISSGNLDDAKSLNSAIFGSKEPRGSALEISTSQKKTPEAVVRPSSCQEYQKSNSSSPQKTPQTSETIEKSTDKLREKKEKNRGGKKSARAKIKSKISKAVVNVFTTKSSKNGKSSNDEADHPANQHLSSGKQDAREIPGVLETRAKESAAASYANSNGDQESKHKPNASASPSHEGNRTPKDRKLGRMK